MMLIFFLIVLIPASAPAGCRKDCKAIYRDLLQDCRAGASSCAETTTPSSTTSSTTSGCSAPYILSAYYPLVRTVRIRGSFPNLGGGCGAEPFGGEAVVATTERPTDLAVRVAGSCNGLLAVHVDERDRIIEIQGSIPCTCCGQLSVWMYPQLVSYPFNQGDPND